MVIDNTDKKILRELLMDAQQSHREIARKTGVSLGTVISRKRKMEENGVIKGYTARLDYEKLGYELTVITEVTVSNGKVVEVGEEIAKSPQAHAVYNATGVSDILVLGRFKSKMELSNFTKRILQMSHVDRTSTHLVLISFKERFALL